MPPYENTIGNLSLPTLSLMNLGGSGNNTKGNQNVINDIRYRGAKDYASRLPSGNTLGSSIPNFLRSGDVKKQSYVDDMTFSNDPGSYGTITGGDVATTGKETGMFGGLGSYMDKLGVTGPDGQLFGLNKDQQAGLGQLAGLGSGVWNMYNADRQYGMMKDYYGKQMELQDKQMARVDKEDARMEGMRSGLAKNY